jgi:hypothetical protein
MEKRAETGPMVAEESDGDAGVTEAITGSMPMPFAVRPLRLMGWQIVDPRTNPSLAPDRLTLCEREFWRQ